MQYVKPCVIVLMAILGCSGQGGQDAVTFKSETVKATDVFLSLETSKFLGNPTRIKAYDGGLYFSDHGYQRVVKVNRKRDSLLTFGSHGRGPGEFESLAGFWVFDDSYLVYDYNGFKFITYDTLGNHLADKVVKKNPVNPDGFPPNIPITVQAISTDKLLIPSRGRNGSLFAIADIETGELTYAGKAVGEHVESFKQEEVEQAFSKGEIPDIFMNLVLLGSSSSGIYSFQQTTGVLEKYSHSGDLIWQKEITIPAQDDLFDQISRHNQQEDQNNHLFTYAKAMDARKDGVAILMNMPEDSPAAACWVSQDGSEMNVITYSDIDKEVGFGMGSFTVSPADKRAYFLNSRKGIIYEANWPL